jgi:4-amino-4-deoxy-L-arabinose transferase-like glycosyltransferase
VEQIVIETQTGEELATDPDGVRRKRRYLIWLIALLAAGLILYSLTMGFVWDEGFHLLAAQLVQQGKTPYIDFCFPQPPLNIYFNAALFSVFGTGWRITHLFASLFLAATAYLAAEFVLLRFTVKLWRGPCALLAALFIALNEVVFQFGPIAQAYASSTFCSVVAFRFTILGVLRKAWFFAFAAGVAAGMAAGCTLLTAPVAPVLLAWSLVHNEAGHRWKKAVAFLVGIAVPFVPALVLFVKGPRQTFFNVVQYQALFRKVNWGNVNAHDFDVFTAWIDSVPTFLLAIFAAFGLFFVARKSGWERTRKAEFYLCGWLAVGATAYISTAHPTFQRYFIVAVPFLSVLAAIGFFFVASRLTDSPRPVWSACLMSGLLVLSAGKLIFDTRESTTWDTYEKMSAKIAKVTPPGGQLFADEHVYFLLGRTPPPGMEFSYSHKLELSPAEEKLYRIVSEKELNAQVKAGKFATVESCKEDRIDDMDLGKLFPQQEDIGDCTIFWGPMKKPN